MQILQLLKLKKLKAKGTTALWYVISVVSLNFMVQDTNAGMCRK